MQNIGKIQKRNGKGKWGKEKKENKTKREWKGKLSKNLKMRKEKI